jgi:glutamate N-acetyltransferase / amino-acid N-acetyltransferase
LTLPQGYRYASVYAGIRKTEKDDLAIIVSDAPASAAAVFTQNRVQASPVRVARQHLKHSRGQVGAVLINAGNANCATRTGDDVAIACCRALAAKLKIEPDHIIPASTGVIGVELNPRLIVKAIPRLVRELAADRFEDVASAIMTTDLEMKTSAHEVPLSKGVVRIAGMTKGSGMIQPNMATTLGFVMMDARLSPAVLKPMLQRTVARSYNQISVDGDTSTNDMLLLLANGASQIKPTEKERRVIEEVLAWVMEDLAEQIARDGEGARKLITIRVAGAPDDASAEKIARTIANSPLVKTAMAGSDPNWGRIICAAGNAGVSFDPNKIDISLQGVLVCHRGLAADFSEAELKHKLDARDILIKLDILGKGRGAARFWTCDLTEKYIEINGSYRT